MDTNRWILPLLSCLIVIVIWVSFPTSNSPYQSSTGQKYDVIIVLGNAPSEDCTPSDIMKQRVLKGVEIFNEGMSNRILFSGGNSVGECIESEIMSSIAVSCGIPDSCIIQENASKNTYQNVYYSVKIMEDLGMKSAIVITSNFHGKRVNSIFSNYDIDFYVCVCDDSNYGIKSWFWKTRESFILLYHYLFGYSPEFGL